MSNNDILLVKWNNLLVGTLTRDYDGSNFFFTYDLEWINNNNIPISVSLPLQLHPFTVKQSVAFFSNLITEGDSIVDIELNLKKIKNNIFNFLQLFGKDCAGALSIFDYNDEINSINYDYIDITSNIEDILSKPLEDRFNLIASVKARLSIAGAQNKLPIYYDKSKFFIPAKNSLAATSHIIKLDSQRFKNLQYNEFFCMNLAYNIGLNVPSATIIKISNTDIFLIERYDRYKESNNIYRLHQEDFCQILGIFSSNKYEELGGPGFNACINAIIKYFNQEDTLSYIYDFLSIIFYNFIIGNCDAHGKNFSLLYDYDYEGFLHNKITKKLAPFYDLVSTQFYPKLDLTMSMKIGETFEHGLISNK
jgi:serine/threonine-protein kinase HipA